MPGWALTFVTVTHLVNRIAARFPVRAHQGKKSSVRFHEAHSAADANCELLHTRQSAKE
jgi:hypothetical protein